MEPEHPAAAHALRSKLRSQVDMATRSATTTAAGETATFVLATQPRQQSLQQASSGAHLVGRPKLRVVAEEQPRRRLVAAQARRGEENR